MAAQGAVTEANELIEAALAFVSKKMVTRPEWGSVTFDEASADFERIFGVVQPLKVLPLENLTDTAIAEISRQLVNTNGTLTSIDAFRIEQGNATEVRDGLVREVHARADELYASTAPWIPFLAYSRGDVEANIKALTKSVTDARDLVEKAKSDISGRTDEIDTIVTAAREASAAAGAAVFTKDFDKEAGELKTDARGWLRVTAILAIGTLAFAVFAFLFAESGLDTSQLVQKTATRLVILATLFTATLWCGRVYKTLLHQSAVNRHRALSLQTFQAFSKAASDNATKDMVLLEATRAVFGSVPTGFIEQSDASPHGLQIVEIAKRIAGEG